MTSRKTIGISELAENARSDGSGSTTSIRETLDRIAAADDHIGAFLHIDRIGAEESATGIGRAVLDSRDPGPLAGVPVGIKDNLATKGLPTTCGSRMLEGYLPPFDATVVRRLKRAGAIIVGKLNMDEFGMGSSNEYSAFKPVRNPWKLDRVPGGSSGGAAAAVAAGMIPAAIGTDTGGSIRQPASFCGVIGLKPTYGRVSRYGLVAFASSLDTPGPLCRTARDCALILQAIAGCDRRDSTSVSDSVSDYVASLERGVRDRTIGVPAEYFDTGIDFEVENALRLALGVYEKLGAKIERISLPHTKYAVPAYYILANAEASSNLARYDGTRYGFRAPAADFASGCNKTRRSGFGPEVKRRILLGTFVLSAGYKDEYYARARRVQTLIQRDFETVFEDGVDLVFAPSSPFPAFPFGEKVADPLAMYQADVCTLPASLAGLPAISVPCGFTGDGLPIGMQLIGRSMAEADLLGAAEAYQQATPWIESIPPPWSAREVCR